jgi:hypothetical protein
MICRDLDKSDAIILEEYLLELCISHFHISFSYSFKLPSKAKDFATQKRKGKQM